LVTTGITGAAAAAGTQNRENTAESKSGMGSDLFLQLLVAQMRYQNPFSGEQDTGQMITQMALFTLLEQVIKVQQDLENQGYAAARSGALSLLNRTVELLDQEGALISGPVTAVSFRGAQPLLTVNGQEFPYAALVKVEGRPDENG
jgi:flagellar basal-body rod modification protein FlgD